jgi:hypothetical protein
MPNFRPSSNSSTPVLARLSATHAIKNYPYSYAMILNMMARCMRRNLPDAHSQRISLIVTKTGGKGMNSRIAVNSGGVVREVIRARRD